MNLDIYERMDLDFRRSWIPVPKQGYQDSYTYDLHFSAWFSSKFKKLFSPGTAVLLNSYEKMAIGYSRSHASDLEILVEREYVKVCK